MQCRRWISHERRAREQQRFERRRRAGHLGRGFGRRAGASPPSHRRGGPTVSRHARPAAPRGRPQPVHAMPRAPHRRAARQTPLQTRRPPPALPAAAAPRARRPLQLPRHARHLCPAAHPERRGCRALRRRAPRAATASYAATCSGLPFRGAWREPGDAQLGQRHRPRQRREAHSAQPATRPALPAG